MDGVENKCEESTTFPLKVVVDPVITVDTEDTQLYVNHPPCTGGGIHINGENFLDGLTPDLYKVTVGDARCEDVTVTHNSITCQPPSKEPKEPHEKHPRVTVAFGTGCLRPQAFKLKYGGPLDCEEMQYIIGCCLSGGLLGAVITVVWCKRRRRFRIRPPSYPYLSPSLFLYGSHLLKRSGPVCRSNNYDLSPPIKNSIEGKYMEPISDYMDVMETSRGQAFLPEYLEMEMKRSVMYATSRVRDGHYENYYQTPRKITRLEEERNRPPLPSLSGRLNVGSRWKTDKQYPDVGLISSARNKRLSDWFPRGETGPKLYGRFGSRRSVMKPKNQRQTQDFPGGCANPKRGGTNLFGKNLTKTVSR